MIISGFTEVQHCIHTIIYCGTANSFNSGVRSGLERGGRGSNTARLSSGARMEDSGQQGHTRMVARQC
ncbi:hypothetical protein MHYP_G00314020 [Metynnis hypsauchen]